MKHWLIALLLLCSAGLTFGAFVDFFCNASAGANINGGSSASTSVYTSTNGNWSTVTNIFTPTDGSNPATASPACVAGDYASIYNDGATVAVYIAKITTVQNATNGTITVSSTLKAGAAPTTSATGRSIKCGGAWKGPNAASGFPFTLSLLPSVAGSGDKLCVNLKNNATYSITAGFTETGSQSCQIQGYSSSVRDGGKATIDGGTSGASYTLLTTSASAGWSHVDLIFDHNGASGAATGVTATSATFPSFIRCVFADMRGTGITTNNDTFLQECEIYGNNLSNTSGSGGAIGGGTFERCISHDNTGSNSAGFNAAASGAQVNYSHCVADTNGGVGFNIGVTTGYARMSNCDAYNNTSDGITASAPTGTIFIENCNLIKNGGWGINFASSPKITPFVYNCGFGSGTQVNTSGTTTGIYSGQEVGSVTYASGATPFLDGPNGKFDIVLSAAIAAGRGAFTTTAGSYGPTTGYPVIGAAQAATPTPTPSATATNTPTATATATATPSFTPCAPTPGPTPTATNTPTPTATASATSTSTPTPTSTVEMSYGFSQ